MKMNEWEWASWIFVIAGAINWGLFGFFKIDLVQVIFSTSTILRMATYGIIAGSGLYWLYKVVFTKK